ncbi:MAG: TIM barrel protein [Hydrotalea flava]|nr:TIM barrel protein [Hydrotalea flava]NIM39346.1 TIM barrel protein [Hydrotalea flava]NIN04535.1 TIM barrel protein [Hydrotalea flava]NIN16207.1 TIM barrel protein [Hydrotalea flava]NIO95272.1 TIM barrel protein [Hydrotalea flava]
MYNRRKAIQTLFTGTATAAAAPFLLKMKQSGVAFEPETSALKGNINHAVCRWTYQYLPLESLCSTAKQIGIKGIDLVGPSDWPVLKKYGLNSSMCNGAELNLTDGWADTKFHAALIPRYKEHIALVGQAGYKNLICFSGSRRGMDDETGWNNCVQGLKQIMGDAEKNNVTIVMELLNSKIDHKDYMCDHTKWGVELCKRIGSPNFKLLYDIYHMQIDEGDVIRTIQEYHPYIAHYHTGGVPGRHEINDTQELYYPAIMKAIVATGFNDFVAQEFIPTGNDKIESLKKAIAICDV